MENMKHFDKIIGYGSIKKEMMRICDIMRNEDLYKNLGVNTPSGLLLHGNPGVGKTTMATCFIAASGRKAFVCRKDKPDGDFVNSIKETFDEAAANAPSIVFLDDMDKYANGDDRHRNCEEFVTVQSCIDAVKGKGVFVLATINDEDALPRSLLRAGRFDSRIHVAAPRGEDAEKIVEYYIRQKKFVAEVDVRTVTRLLDGASCAELETVINEAGVYAGFMRKEKIEMEDIVSACLRVIHQAPEAENAYSPVVLERIAYHEAGHAVMAELLEPGSVNFVSVRPHGGNTGGFTSYYQPDEYWVCPSMMENRVLSLLGGKAASEIRFSEVDTGTGSDLNRAFRIMGRFVDDFCSHGFGHYTSSENSNELLAGRDACVHTEMERLYKQTKKMLTEHRAFLDGVAHALMKKDVLTAKEIEKIKEDTLAA